MSKSKYIKIFGSIFVLGFCFIVGVAFAVDNNTLGGIAERATESFQSIGKLMAATAYLAGFGLTITAIFKFKQHKDNPQQIPLGTPLALLVVGIALIFLPSFVGPAGQTLFGGNATAGGFHGSGALSLPNATTNATE